MVAKYGRAAYCALLLTALIMLMGCLEIEKPTKNQRFVRGDTITFEISGISAPGVAVTLQGDKESGPWGGISDLDGNVIFHVDTSGFDFVPGEITKHKFTAKASGQSNKSVEVYVIPRCHAESGYVCELPYHSECRSSTCNAGTDSCWTVYPLYPCSDYDLDTYDFCQVNDNSGDEFCFNNETDYPINEHVVGDKTYHWFLGQDWQSGHWGERPYIQWEPGATWMSDLVYGTDLGISIEFNGLMRTYMGDSTMRPQTWGVPEEDRKCNPGCTRGHRCSRCNNAITISNDTNPTDGVTLRQILFEYNHLDEMDTVPIKVPGVHYNNDPAIWGGWFNTITGIAANEERDTQKIVLFYVTSSRSSLLRDMDNSDPHADGLAGSGVAGRSWLAWSDDGVTFTNCYDNDGLYDPFSESSIILKSEPPFTQQGDLLLTRQETHTGKFLQVSPVFIDDLSDIEGSCRPATSGPGLLLYGTGVPYRYSNVYLAYVPLDQLCDKSAVRYFTGVHSGGCWSTQESQAQPLFDDQIIQTFDYLPLFTGGDGTLDYAIPTGKSVGIGELSVKYVPEINGLVMLSNESWCPDGGFLNYCLWNTWSSEALFRSAPLARPWEWSSPRSTGTPGYGPYIMDRYTTYDAGSQSLELYYVTSVWQGDFDGSFNPPNRETPYGVETTSSVFNIAPY